LIPETPDLSSGASRLFLIGSIALVIAKSKFELLLPLQTVSDRGKLLFVVFVSQARVTLQFTVFAHVA
jgi:hypothetical protein